MAAPIFDGIDQLADLLGGEVVGGPRTGAPEAFGIDSRTLGPGGLFFALPGTRTDGHAFLADVAARGAWGAVASDRAAAEAAGLPVVLVEKVEDALLGLAEHRRRQLEYPMVGITGTNGKTSTKDLVATILSARMEVARTPGNLNNLLGLPLAILQPPAHADLGVFELGMSYPGEIDRLARLLRPRYGVITNVAEAHLETMKTLEAVRDAKAELIPHIEEGGVLYLNGDDPSTSDLASRAEGIEVRRVSTRGLNEAEAVFDVERVSLTHTEGELILDRLGGGRRDHHPVAWPVPGRHMVYPLLFAALLARDLGLTVDAELVEQVVNRQAATPGRMWIHQVAGFHLLDDSYNANPRSVEAALSFLVEADVPGRRYCVLGDMLELGKVAVPCHRAVFEHVRDEVRIARAWFFGRCFMEALTYSSPGPRRRLVVGQPRETIVEELRELLTPGDLVLVKGSRGVALDRVVAGLREAFEGAPKPC